MNPVEHFGLETVKRLSLMQLSLSVCNQNDHAADETL